MTDPAVITTIANVILTPVLVLVTLWIKGNNAKEERRDRRDDTFIQALAERVERCEKRHDEREKEIRAIQIELKNRDAEYIVLYKQYTTLKAQHEVLQTDHDSLKKQYDTTVSELATLKDDIKSKAAEAAMALKTI